MKRNILITGSTDGLGKLAALKLANEGHTIYVHGRNTDKLSKVIAEIKSSSNNENVKGFVADFSDLEAVKKMAQEVNETVSSLDVLINNAGISTEGEIGELDDDVFRKVMEVNYLGSVYPTQAALPFLRKTKGSVIFVSSVAGIRGIPGYSVYSSSKMALTALAESLKIEEKQRGVHVGIAYVGFTENDKQKTIYNSKGEIIPQPARPG